ncbi:hypothetical protein ACFYT4_24250 [Streptomyces sp. NPDC004609]|uniref:hypothetical protein n=1 Tax=Streptomyces sp. NPDC004609 TaxID=3364704 RepID=UPI00368C6853
MFGRRGRRDPSAERPRGGGIETVRPAADPEERVRALRWLQDNAGRCLDYAALSDREERV